jgi:hypothetical protein
MSDEKHHSSAKFPDDNTRFHLHGPTYSEMKAEEARTQAEFRKIFDAIRQWEPRKVAEAAVISTGGEILDDGVPDDDIDPATLVEPDEADRADINPEELAENPLDFDPNYFFQPDGKVWVWWQLGEDSLSAHSRGHNHEIVPEVDKYWQLGSDPEGFFYLRDGVSMKAYFGHLRDAMACVEREIQAQVDFERRLWCTVRVRGMSLEQQRYVLEHAYYQDRIALCEEYLANPQKNWQEQQK